ncbi:UNVERIFIED_CONTAM: hypothetical protein RKD43_000244 [Streptomyces graminofaciens]
MLFGGRPVELAQPVAADDRQVVRVTDQREMGERLHRIAGQPRVVDTAGQGRRADENELLVDERRGHDVLLRGPYRGHNQLHVSLREGGEQIAGEAQRHMDAQSPSGQRRQRGQDAHGHQLAGARDPYGPDMRRPGPRRFQRRAQLVEVRADTGGEIGRVRGGGDAFA